MNSLVIYGKNEKENEYLKYISKEKIALYSEEAWDISVYDDLEEFKEYLDTKPLLRIAYIDITKDGIIDVVEQIRKDNKDVVIMLIADTSISPMKYIKPSIMAASLLLRPLKKTEVNEQVSQILKLFSKNSENLEDYFSVEYKGEKINIPYSRILYFEAREKKIFLGLENTEYGFYDTMNALEEKLPEYFLRCGRSFIFNQKKLKKISFTENILELESEIVIPISRRYRQRLKGL